LADSISAHESTPEDEMDAMSMLVRLSEAGAEESGVPAWVFGLSAFAALAIALFVVTRFNPDR
jgi:hypothetical protein